ncbi:MAG TPA: hypothetical protein VN914_04725, partial [Polyangia bacterium]|nr:hypothetical protein [Polyangia bacterium]
MLVATRRIGPTPAPSTAWFSARRPAASSITSIARPSPIARDDRFVEMAPPEERPWTQRRGLETTDQNVHVILVRSPVER